MNTILVGINSKYIHSCLSIRYLRAFCPEFNIQIQEYTINEQIDSVTASIYKSKPDIVLFSCYIWNINFVLSVAENLKKVSDIKIVLGGPEVSFNAKEVLEKNSYIDEVIIGEGELTLKEYLNNKANAENILSMAYRKNSDIIVNESRPLINDLNIIPFPYTDDDIKLLNGKLIYYESSRGCPFKCSYCLSSTIHSVRFFNLERVKRELLFFTKHKVKIIKFVDRTFNANYKRTYELINFLINNADATTFHFEIAADLIDENMLNLLKTAPKNLFQFEIGIQSTNSKTLSEIDRNADLNKIKTVINNLIKLNNMHIHVDLIAGLPYEDYSTFKKSFNEVYALKPHMLQLGFLKMLKGTKISTQKEQFNYKHTSLPPYEILQNEFISYDDILNLKSVENVLELFYNSGIFNLSINYLSQKYSSGFELFANIADFFSKKGYDKMPHAQKKLYSLLHEFYYAKFNDEIFSDYLKFDYLRFNKGVTTPTWSILPYDKELLKFRFEFLNNEKNIQKYLPEYIGIPAKEIMKTIHFERFCYDILDKGHFKQNIIIFDYLYERYVKIQEMY